MIDVKKILMENGLLEKVIDKMIVKNLDDSKLDGITFKYLDKNVYQITNDIIFKQCSKCKNFKEINQFPRLSKSSNCLFQKNYYCSACIKESRPAEKEHQYYLNRRKKLNPNYVPLSERMTKKKITEKLKEEKLKAKLEKSNNVADTNIQIEKQVEPIVEVKQVEPIVVQEINKVVQVKDIPVEIKLETKKQRKSKKSDNLYTPISIKPSEPVVEKVVVDLTEKKIPRRRNNNATSLSEQNTSQQLVPSSSKKTAKSK